MIVKMVEIVIIVVDDEELISKLKDLVLFKLLVVLDIIFFIIKDFFKNYANLRELKSLLTTNILNILPTYRVIIINIGNNNFMNIN